MTYLHNHMFNTASVRAPILALFASMAPCSALHSCLAATTVLTFAICLAVALRGLAVGFCCKLGCSDDGHFLQSAYAVCSCKVKLVWTGPQH